MEDDDVLRTLQRQTRFALTLMSLGLSVMCLATLFGWSHPSGEPPNPAPYFLGWVIIFAGLYAAWVARTNWDLLKQEMVAYAYRRAEHEGTKPDFAFLYCFDYWRRGPAEWEILRRAYAEMMSWSPAPALSYGPLDRPYQMVEEEDPQSRCGGCGALRKSEDLFCSRCGTRFPA